MTAPVIIHWICIAMLFAGLIASVAWFVCCVQALIALEREDKALFEAKGET